VKQPNSPEENRILGAQEVNGRLSIGAKDNPRDDQHGDWLTSMRDVHALPGSRCHAGELTTNAHPTISISESPGIHSTAIQARDGALPGLK
jgi:hypothetical protein